MHYVKNDKENLSNLSKNELEKIIYDITMKNENTTIELECKKSYYCHLSKTEREKFD